MPLSRGYLRTTRRGRRRSGRHPASTVSWRTDRHDRRRVASGCSVARAAARAKGSRSPMSSRVRQSGRRIPMKTAVSAGHRSEARPRFLGPDSPGGPPSARRCRCYGDASGAWSGPDVRRLKGPLIDGSGCRSGFPTARSPTPIGGFGLSGAARIGAPLVGTPHLPRTRSAQGCRSARPSQLPPVWVSAREGAVRRRSRGSFRRADR